MVCCDDLSGMKGQVWMPLLLWVLVQQVVLRWARQVTCLTDDVTSLLPPEDAVTREVRDKAGVPVHGEAEVKVTPRDRHSGARGQVGGHVGGHVLGGPVVVGSIVALGGGGVHKR